MRASAGQCGVDSSCCRASKVEAVVGLDHPGLRNMDESSESVLFCVATLHRFGLPYRYICRIEILCSAGGLRVLQCPLMGPISTGFSCKEDLRMAMPHGTAWRRRKEASGT
jgi:hypothetical protein